MCWNNNSLPIHYMNKLNKVKKTIDKTIENKIINGDVLLFDTNTGEQIENIKIKTSKYKLILSNNKHYMKKWTDRKLNLEIKKELSLLEKEILFDVLDYIDEENIIDFKRLAIDYNYSPSKISKAKSWLKSKLLIKEHNWLYYLSPLIWIKYQKEISMDLLELFQDSFEKYWIEINYK